MAATIIDGVYYEDGQPKHAGVVQVDGAIYYAGRGGVLATGEKTVHREMANGILKRGVYRFGEDGKLVKGFYIPPEKSSRKGKEKRRLRLLSGKTGKMLCLALACLAILFILAAEHYGWFTPKVVLPDADLVEVSTDQAVALPSFSGEQYLCTAPLRDYYQGRISLRQAIEANRGAYAPLVFRYRLPENASAVLTLDGKQYTLDPGQESLSIDNLLTGGTYEYTVEVKEVRESAEQLTTYHGSLTTAAANRFISLPGVKNTRDIGGYQTPDGKRVKQGMIIRGTELDGLVESKLFLTDKEAAEAFGFKTEMDLREGSLFAGDYQSRLGEEVTHRFYGAPAYSGVFASSARPILREIFSDLADEDNYPIYLHCTHGADRTGTLVYLLQGVLGVSDEDKELEYRLTGFFISAYGSNYELNGLYGGLDSMPGETINEKICSFLTRDVGVTEQQLDSIRAILLETP